MDIYSFFLKTIVTDNIKDYRFRKIINSADALSPNDSLSEDDHKLVALIQEIVSLVLLYDKGETKYQIHARLEGTRSFSPEDMSDEDWGMLNSIEFDKLPIPIKARLYDFLWEQKKDHNSVVNAIDAYLIIFDSIWDEKNWIDCANIIARATNIAAQYDKKSEEYKRCIDAIINGIIRTNGADSYFLSIRLFELLDYQKIKRSDLTKYAEKIVETAFADNNLAKQESATKLICKLFNGKPEKIKEYNEKLAEKYLILARDQADVTIRRIYYLKKAIRIYRETKNEKLIQLYHELEELENLSLSQMHLFTTKIDVTEEYKIVSEEMNKQKTLLDFLLLIASATPIYSKTKLFDMVKSSQSITTKLFPKTKINNEGKVIITFPTLDINKADIHSENAELFMWDTADQIQRNAGDTYLTWLYEGLNQKYSYEINDIDFLTKSNPIIPDGREYVIQKGIYIGLKGDYYTALHILAPQVENIFRNIAHMCGDITFTLENDNSSQVKTLSSVFELPYLVDSMDEDVLFCFKGLLNEKSGSNLRNEIAHGIMKPEIANQGIGKYFLGAVLKLLLWYAQIPDKDDIKKYQE